MRRGVVFSFAAGLALTIFATQTVCQAQVADKHPKGTALGRAGSATSDLAVEGFAQFRFEADHSGSKEATQTYFRLRRLRLRVTGDWLQHFRVRVQLALQEFAKDNAGGEVLEDAYIQFNPDASGISERFQLLLGQQKLPMMREELRSASAQLVVDRGTVNSYFKNQGGWVSYDMGVLLDGNLYDMDVPFGYQIGVFNGEGRNRPKDFMDPNTGKLFAARATVSPLVGLELGGSVAARNLAGDDVYGKYTIGKGSANLPGDYSEMATAFGAELGFVRPLGRSDRLTVEAEMLQGTNMETFLKAASADPSVKPSDKGYTMRGFQVTPHLFHQLSGEGLVKGLEIGARFGQMDPDVDGSDNAINEVTVTCGAHVGLMGSTPNLSRLQVEVTSLSYEDASMDSDWQAKAQWQVQY